MNLLSRSVLRGVALAGLLATAAPVHAEYLRIQLRVYGLDCELCARGVGASLEWIEGVKSVNVSLKNGMLDIVLAKGNTVSLSEIRKRIRKNGFRPMEATVTAVGRYSGSRFHIVGTSESYDIGRPASEVVTPVELTFEVR